MKQAILGYEQKFFINGTQLSGVQSVNGSYAISEKPINVLGWGNVNSGFYPEEEYILRSDGTSFILDGEGFRMMLEESCPQAQAQAPGVPGMAVLNAPLEGSFSINSALVSEDFFLRHTGDNPFTGSINHGTKYFGFYNGYITNHSVNCQIGQIPKTSTSIKIFGDMGGSPSYFKVQEGDGFMKQEDGFLIGTEGSMGEYGYNASGSNPFPTIKVPNQGSITIECAGASTDRVTSFNHSIDMPLSAIYTVGSSVAAQVDVVWPFTTTTSFSLDIDKYNYSRLRAYLRAPTVQDIAVNINDCFGGEIQRYPIKNARLIGEEMSASSEGRLTVNLKYKSYYNKR